MKLSTTLMLLATVFIVAGAKETARSTRKFTFNSSYAYTVAIDTNLYTVSYYDTKLSVNSLEERQVYLNLISSDEDYKPCKILLDPQSQTIRGRIMAAPIWRKIAVWGVRNRTEYENCPLVNHTFLLVDPRTCTHLALPNFADGPFWDLKMVVHQDRLDIFYTTQTARARCTFDLNGNKVDAERLGKSKESLRVMGWEVRAIGKSYDHVIVYTVWDEPPTNLFLYSRNFKLKNWTWLETNVETVAHNSVENKAYIGVISYHIQNILRQRVYTVFDENLNVVFETYPPLLDGYFLASTYAHIDSAGNSCLILMQGEEQCRKFTMVRYDVNGRLIDEAVVGPTIDLGDGISYEVQTVLVDEREYCLVIHTILGLANKLERPNITCVEIVGKH